MRTHLTGNPVRRQTEAPTLPATDKVLDAYVAGYRGDAWLDRTLPAAAWGVRVAVRGARMAAAFPPAWRLHRQLRGVSG